MPFVLIPVVVVVYALQRAYREVDEQFVAEWAAAHALMLTPQNTPMVHRYLHKARVFRTWGVVAGLALPPLLSRAFGFNLDGIDGTPIWAFVGYLLGALYAELALIRPRGGVTRRAVLAPRSVDDYLPRRLYLAPACLGALVLGVSAVAALLPYERSTRNGMHVSGASALAAGGVAVVAAIVVALLQHWVIRRAQPLTEADLLAADDAVRSQSLHSLAGSGLAIEFLALSGVCWTLLLSDVQLLRWTMWIAAVASAVAAIYACLYYGHRAWRVPRRFVTATS